MLPVPPYLLLGEDDDSQQLVLESLYRHREIDDRRLRAHFGRVRRITEFRRYVQREFVHHIDLLIADHDLERAAGLYEVLLKDVVERRVEFFGDVLDDQGATERERVLQMRSEVLVVE